MIVNFNEVRVRTTLCVNEGYKDVYKTCNTYTFVGVAHHRLRNIAKTLQLLYEKSSRKQNDNRVTTYRFLKTLGDRAQTVIPRIPSTAQEGGDANKDHQKHCCFVALLHQHVG